MKETERDITRIFRAEHGAGTEEAKALVEEVYEAMKGAEPAAFDDVHNHFVSRTEEEREAPDVETDLERRSTRWKRQKQG
ncbi:MAG: hypothetical protein ABEL51_13910 [Salinibacter sp.]